MKRWVSELRALSTNTKLSIDIKTYVTRQQFRDSARCGTVSAVCRPTIEPIVSLKRPPADGRRNVIPDNQRRTVPAFGTLILALKKNLFRFYANLPHHGTETETRCSHTHVVPSAVTVVARQRVQPVGRRGIQISPGDCWRVLLSVSSHVRIVPDRSRRSETLVFRRRKWPGACAGRIRLSERRVCRFRATVSPLRFPNIGPYVSSTHRPRTRLRPVNRDTRAEQRLTDCRRCNPNRRETAFKCVVYVSSPLARGAITSVRGGGGR